MKPRPYQSDCVNAVMKAFRTHRRVLAVLPVGTGKTPCAVWIAQPFIDDGMRVMFAAHTKELLIQAKQKFQSIAKEQVEIEQGDRWAAEGRYFSGEKAKIVVTSIQTQTYSKRGSKPRMLRFKPNEFGLLIIDETHRATSASYQTWLKYFCETNPNIKVLGITATPDRFDGKSLRGVYETCAYRYEMPQAIDDGWLVPYRSYRAVCKDLNLDAVAVTAGDLSGSQLEEQMIFEKPLHFVADLALRKSEGRKTMVFCAGVKHAVRLEEILNRPGYEPGCARCVTAETEEEERAQIVSAYRCNAFRIMVNVGVFGEGADFPDVGCIVNARPTRSRTVFIQIIGRGGRPLPGVVDGLEEDGAILGPDGEPVSMAMLRRDSIGFSDKPDCLLLDVAGTSTRHSLVCASDVLAGEDYSADVIAYAAQFDGDVRANLERAKREKEEKQKADELRRAKISGHADVHLSPTQIGSQHGANMPRYKTEPPSEQMIAKLYKWKVPHQNLSRGQARGVMAAIMDRLEYFKSKGQDFGHAWGAAVGPFRRNPLAALGEHHKASRRSA